MSTTPSRLNWIDLAAYAAPALGLSALNVPLIAYLPNFYASEVGLSLASVGTAFLVVRLLDIGIDPVLGALIDHTITPFGRCRPYLLAGAPLLAVAALLLFIPPAGAGFSYLTACLFMIYLGYSLCMVAHVAWGSALTPDYHERSRIFTWWQSGNAAGMVLLLCLPIILETLGGARHSLTIAAMGISIAVLVLAGTAIAMARLKEPMPNPATSRRNQPTLRAQLSILRHSSVRRIVAVDFLYGLGIGMNGGAFVFFFTQIKHVTLAETAVLLFANLFGLLVGTPLWNWLVPREKHISCAIATLCYCLSLIVILYLPAPLAWERVVELFACGLPLSAVPMLIRSMLADCGDEVHWLEGVEHGGILSALLVGSQKLGLAGATGLTFFLLDLAGFKAEGANNTDLALLGVKVVYIFIPILLGLISAGLMTRHTLTEARHREIRDQLAKGNLRQEQVPGIEEASVSNVLPIAGPRLVPDDGATNML